MIRGYGWTACVLIITRLSFPAALSAQALPPPAPAPVPPPAACAKFSQLVDLESMARGPCSEESRHAVRMLPATALSLESAEAEVCAAELLRRIALDVTRDRLLRLTAVESLGGLLLGSQKPSAELWAAVGDVAAKADDFVIAGAAFSALIKRANAKLPEAATELPGLAPVERAKITLMAHVLQGQNHIGRILAHRALGKFNAKTAIDLEKLVRQIERSIYDDPDTLVPNEQLNTLQNVIFISSVLTAIQDANSVLRAQSQVSAVRAAAEAELLAVLEQLRQLASEADSGIIRTASRDAVARISVRQPVAPPAMRPFAVSPVAPPTQPYAASEYAGAADFIGTASNTRAPTVHEVMRGSTTVRIPGERSNLWEAPVAPGAAGAVGLPFVRVDELE